MYWTLSEFLNTFEFRSQSWCLVELTADQGIHIPHSDEVFFYSLLQGQLRMTGVGRKEVELKPGDILFAISGEAHALRPRRNCQLAKIPLLQNGGYVDSPPTIVQGTGPAEVRLLCGRLKVRWPTGHCPHGMPSHLILQAEEAIVRVERLLDASRNEGGAALLTRVATLLFVEALRESSRCQALFGQSNRADPIARARQLIEMHPFQGWSVASLAKKVGMSRSSFAAHFVSQVGRTPMDVLAEERMRQAASFLARSDLKIAEVSERVGYRSEAAFHHRFTLHFGISPGKFRRQSRSVDQRLAG